MSIITPTTDRADYIDQALASVPHDAVVEIEHIVVHDGSERFAAGIRKRHPRIKLLMGPGKGPAAAVAAAFAAATGDFLLELNSDDRLVGSCLERLQSSAAAHPDIAIWTGGARIFRTDAGGAESVVREILARDLTRLSLENLLDDITLITTRFLHRAIIEKIGNLDARWSYSCDREFLLRAFLAEVPEAPLDTVVQELREHDGSRTINRRTRWIPPYLAEHIAIAEGLLRSDLAPVVREELRNWRAREILRLAYCELRSGQAGAAIKRIAEAERRDLLWVARTTTAARAWLRRRR